MMALMANDGVLTLRDLETQLRDEQWIPVVVKKPKDQPGPITLLSFSDHDVARRFAKRNMPKGWLYGGVYLSDKDVEWVVEQGWQVEYFDWPNRININKFDLVLEILTFHTKPNVYVS